MKMGAWILTLVFLSEAASSPLACTQLKKAWSGEMTLLSPSPHCFLTTPAHLQNFPGQPKAQVSLGQRPWHSVQAGMLIEWVLGMGQSSQRRQVRKAGWGGGEQGDDHQSQV